MRFESISKFAFVGPDAPEHISSLAMDGDAVWAASGPHVIKYLRGKEVRDNDPIHCECLRN